MISAKRIPHFKQKIREEKESLGNIRHAWAVNIPKGLMVKAEYRLPNRNPAAAENLVKKLIKSTTFTVRKKTPRMITLARGNDRISITNTGEVCIVKKIINPEKIVRRVPLWGKTIPPLDRIADEVRQKTRVKLKKEYYVMGPEGGSLAD